jgi:hypothetical protein
MALAHLPRATEVNILRDEFLAISEIQQVFVLSQDSSLSVLIMIHQHDLAVERRIAEIEGAMSDQFPWLAIDFDIVFLQGRNPADVVSPRGFQLFAR